MNLNNLVKIQNSNIHGIGVFTNNKINKNIKIGIGIEYYYFIPHITKNLGSLINHSYNPNCRLEFIDNKYYIVTNKNLNKNIEITLNYNNTPWFISNADDNFK